MNSQLILLTAEFPYGLGETFLESEIKILAKNFSKVTILHSNKSETFRNIPANCDYIHLDHNKKIKFSSYLSNLFNPFLIIELLHVVFIQKKISLGIFKTAINSIIRAKKIKKQIEQKISNQAIKNALFYSYWCDDHAIAICLLKKKHFSFCISRAHGWDVYFENSKYNYLPFRNLIGKNLNKLYPISKTGMNYIINNWKTNTNLNVSYLGVSKNKFLPYNKTPIIVSCSNLIPLKRVHLIIEAFHYLKDEITWIHFGDGPELANLLEKAKKLPKNIHVIWKGRIKNEDVLDFYAKNNPRLFINVSNSEGIPVSIMESFSFGIPAIATNVGGNHEIVNNENGILLEENPEPKKIADAIFTLVNLEEKELLKLKETAFNTWETKFNSEINYQNFINDLKETASIT